MSTKSPRRRSNFPGSLTDLHRFRKTVHGHDGSSRIVMVRKTDQRTFASIQNGKEPKLETITRETIETFTGQRTACKITTERKGCEEKIPADLFEAITDRSSRKSTPVRTRSLKTRNVTMDFQNECLRAHNEFRRRHNAPPLKMNREICSVSQDHANYLVRKNNLEHSNNRTYGENIYCLTTSDKGYVIKGDEAVKEWYGEGERHDYDSEPSSLSTGHFTQVVWKDCKEFGVGYAKMGGKIVVVANYYPAGNVIGCFRDNVLPVNVVERNNNVESGLRLSTLSISGGKKKPQLGIGTNFRKECLEAHNNYRKKHGAPPLRLDEELNRHSEEWAKLCAERNILEHRKNNPYGENIYCIYSSDPNFSINGNESVDSWYEEMKSHSFGKEPNNLKSGHFTQVVWKTSERLGVGVARRNNHIYVVCNYSPAGNFVGSFAENVLPLGAALAETTAQNQTSTSSNFSTFELDALKSHNDFRRKHGTQELSLNKDMCLHAEEWAKECSVYGMNHRPKNKYGENIYMCYSSDFSFTPSAKEAITAWYNEHKDYNFGVEYVNVKALHFTQLIWKDSKELGIGMAKNGRGETFIVANYHPRGNIVGQFVSNVSKPRM